MLGPSTGRGSSESPAAEAPHTRRAFFLSVSSADLALLLDGHPTLEVSGGGSVSERDSPLARRSGRRSPLRLRDPPAEMLVRIEFELPTATATAADSNQRRCPRSPSRGVPNGEWMTCGMIIAS